MHNIWNLFYFGTTLYVSNDLSAHHLESKTVHTASYHTGSVAACYQAATEPVWHIPDAVCTVLVFWWWTESKSETCRVLFKKKFWYRASGCFYYRNVLYPSAKGHNQLIPKADSRQTTIIHFLSSILHSDLRQVHSSFQSDFPTEYDLVLSPSISAICCLPQGNPVAAYVFLLIFPSHLYFLQ
jgi:hypothetical protein